MIFLDTSFLIRGLASGTREDRRLRAWLRAGRPVGMSSIGWAEFLCGPVDAQDIDLASRILAEPEPFVAADSITAARLFNVAGRRRGCFVDCMIAAVALRVGAPLATANPTDFRRFEAAGLRVLGPRSVG